jgi:hypothetical protein
MQRIVEGAASVAGRTGMQRWMMLPVRVRVIRRLLVMMSLAVVMRARLAGVPCLRSLDVFSSFCFCFVFVEEKEYMTPP